MYDLTDTTIDDISSRDERKLEEFKTYYNHETLEEALEDLKSGVAEEGDAVDKLDVEMDILYVVGAREDLEPEESRGVCWCAGCGDTLIVGSEGVSGSYGGMARHVSGEGMVCGQCVEHDEMEPLATVTFSDSEMPHTIGDYHDRTEGEFEIETTRHDAWRVSHSVKPADEEKWRALNTGDVILSYSKDAEELKKLDEKVMEYARDRGIRVARATGRTSNVFSSTYDLYVKAPSAEDWELLELQLYVAGLKREHRDDYRFRATALTGKDPEDMEEHDEKFVAAAQALSDGAETPHEAVEAVREEGIEE